jgi:hypothetical protein
VPHVIGSGQHPPLGADQLRGHHVSPAQGNSRPVRVPWAPAPASRRRTTPGAPRVPVASGRRKNVKLTSSETELWTIFFSTRRPVEGSSGGSMCPRGSRPNEDHRGDAKDLAKLVGVRQHRFNRSGIERRGGGRQLPNRSRSNLRWASCSRSEGGAGASRRQRRRWPSRA